MQLLAVSTRQLNFVLNIKLNKKKINSTNNNGCWQQKFNNFIIQKMI